MAVRLWLLLTLFVCGSGVQAAPVAQAGPFEFHSDFWLNLHHFLYEQALHEAKLPTDLSAGEKANWEKAIALYRRSFIQHDLLNDPHMESIDTELAEDETMPKLAVAGADAGLWDMLNSVAGIYRAHWWGEHDKKNRALIAASVALVQKYGSTLIQQMTSAYDAAWPKELIRVDMAEYANWAGAYTYTYSWNRVHVIMSSADAANQGNAALEILFHEASHGMVFAHSGRLAEQIQAAAKAKNVKTPPDIVHVFIFYTAGELARRDLAAAGVANYVPYADLKRLYQDRWAPWHKAIAVYWKQHLDGRLAYNDAVSQIVSEAGVKSGK